MAKQFVVSFYRAKEGDPGRGARARIQGTIGQLLGGAQSETAVQGYLQQKYPGDRITIMSLDWK